MILTIDVGNTNITCGVFKGDEIVATFRITTKMPRTSDEYGMILYNLLEQNEIKPSDIKDTIICSVVPNVMHSLHGAFAKYFHINPIVVEAGIKTGIRIVTPNPQQIGAVLTILAAGLLVPVLPYLLSFAAGAMLYVVVEELIPEMSQGEHSDIGTICFAFGFTLMMILDVALG